MLRLIIIWFLLVPSLLLFGNDQEDDLPSSADLQLLSLVQLDSFFHENRGQIPLAKVISKVALNKLATSEDIEQNIRVYLMRAEALSGLDSSIVMANSALQLAKKIKNHEYIFLATYRIGAEHYMSGRFDECTTFFTKCSLLLDHVDPFYKIKVDHAVGLLNVKLNNLEYAGKLFEANMVYFHNEENKEKHSRQYLMSLMALADYYVRSGFYDMSLHLNRQGLSYADHVNNTYLFNHFLLETAVSLSHLENYEAAIDTLKIGIDRTNDENLYLNNCYKFIVYCNIKLNRIDSAIHYVEHQESLYAVDSTASLRALNMSYDEVINYANHNNLSELELKYRQRKSNINSQINLQNRQISNAIQKIGFDKNKLELEKNISSLGKKTTALIFLLFVSVLFIISKIVLVKPKEQKSLLEYSYDKSDKNSSVQVIDESKKEAILQKLELFERSLGFCNSDVTLHILAKQFKTNSTYLSNIINSYKGVNFSNYMKTLKLNYIIEQLKSNEHYQHYSVEALAREAGFRSARSFSRAFKDQQGISPSIFVKKLSSKKREDIIHSINT